jgi:hypothetical protein
LKDEARRKYFSSVFEYGVKSLYSVVINNLEFIKISQSKRYIMKKKSQINKKLTNLDITNSHKSKMIKTILKRNTPNENDYNGETTTFEINFDVNMYSLDEKIGWNVQECWSTPSPCKSATEKNSSISYIQEYNDDHVMFDEYIDNVIYLKSNIYTINTNSNQELNSQILNIQNKVQLEDAKYYKTNLNIKLRINNMIINKNHKYEYIMCNIRPCLTCSCDNYHQTNESQCTKDDMVLEKYLEKEASALKTIVIANLSSINDNNQMKDPFYLIENKIDSVEIYDEFICYDKNNRNNKKFYDPNDDYYDYYSSNLDKNNSNISKINNHEIASNTTTSLNSSKNIKQWLSANLSPILKFFILFFIIVILVLGIILLNVLFKKNKNKKKDEIDPTPLTSTSPPITTQIHNQNKSMIRSNDDDVQMKLINNKINNNNEHKA